MRINIESKLQKQGIGFNNPLSKTLETDLANKCIKDNAFRKLVTKKILGLIQLLNWLEQEGTESKELH